MINRPASRVDRPEFPQLLEDIGEDPARYLAYENRDLIFARIRGLDYLERAHAFLAIERRLHDGGREDVLEALEDRIATLQEIGDRDERLEDLERIGVDDDRDDVELLWIHSECRAPVRQQGRAYRCPRCEQTTNRVELPLAGVDVSGLQEGSA